MGVLVGVAHHDSEFGAKGLTITTNQVNDQPVFLYANTVMILDQKNKLPGDEVINVHLSAP